MYSVWYCACIVFVFFFKQKTAYEMRISDWSSDVCSSDLQAGVALAALEQCQLAGDVALALSGHARVHRVGRVAVDAVAGCADGGLLRAGLRVAPGGRG